MKQKNFALAQREKRFSIRNPQELRVAIQVNAVQRYRSAPFKASAFGNFSKKQSNTTYKNLLQRAIQHVP